MPFPLLLPVALSLAAPVQVQGGAQVALTPSGVDMAAGWFSNDTYSLEEDQVGGAWDCWDELGIRGFNLLIPVDDIQVDLQDGWLDVAVTFGTIEGRDMTVYGLDEDWLDTCPEFESELYYLTVTRPAFRASLAPEVRDGALTLDVLGTPVVSGDLDMDIDWFPDDLVLAFYEETLFEELGSALQTLIPEMVASFVGPDTLSGTFEEFSVAATPVDAGVSPQALLLGADLDTHWVGDRCSSETDAQGAGRSPTMDLSASEDATLALGITEHQLNATFRQLQSDGFFCFDADRMDLVVEEVSAFFDPTVAGLVAEAALTQAPTLVVEKSGATASLPGLTLQIRGNLDGEPVLLLSMEADLSSTLDVGLEPSLTSVTLSLSNLELDIQSLDATHLLSDSPEAQAHLEGFLESWAASWVEEELQDTALFVSQYYLYGTWVRLERVEYQAGGMRVWLKLYDEDDPAVDKVPPDTEAWLESKDPSSGSAVVGWSGTDDRSDPLAWSVQVDGAGWSSFTLMTTQEIPDLLPGPHLVEVKARDAWLNEDQTPSQVPFDLEAASGDDPGSDGGCGCGSTRPGGVGLLALALATLLARKRRFHEA